jgi:predicted RND superfamily exporter protein
MWAKIAEFILRYRLFLFIAIAVSTLFMGYMGTKIQLTYDFAKIIPADDKDFIDYLKFKERFGEDGNVLVIGVQSDKLFDLPFFNDWYDLSEKIEKSPGIEKLVSISRIYTIQKNDSLHRFDFNPVITSKPKTQAELDSLKEMIKGLSFYKGLVLNEKGNVTLMAVTLDKTKVNSKARIKMVKTIEDLAVEFGKKHNVEVYYSGLPYIRTIVAQKVAKELIIFTFLSMLVSAIIMLLFFRSFYAVVCSLLVVFIGVVWSLGTMVLFGYKITMLTGLIPPMIVIIGIQNCIYLLNVYHFEFRSYNNKMKALHRTLTKIGLASFLTNATTAVGFGVFITGSAILDEFGIIAAINIMVVYAVSMIIIPGISCYLPPPTMKQTRHLENRSLDRFMNLIDKLVHNNRKQIYIVTAIFLVVAFLGVYKVNSIGYIVDDIPRKEKLFKDLKFFERNFNGVMPFEIVIDAKRKGAFKRLSELNKVDELQQVLAGYPEFSKPVSIVEMAKFANQAFYRGNPEHYMLPNEQEKNFILPYAARKGMGNNDLMKALVDSTYQIARVSVQMEDVGSVEMERLKNELRARVDSIFDKEKYDVKLTGTSVIFLKSNEYLIDNLITSMILAFIIISLMMAFLFTSAKMIVISLIPNVIPLIFTLGIMGFFNINLKPSTILIFSVAYGITVDTTIHFLAKYRHELRRNNWDVSVSISRTLKEAGMSMVYTSVVLFFGFIIFAASTFGGTVALGVLTSITLLIAMFTNLLVLPATILSFQKNKDAKEELESSLIDIEEE